MDDRVPNREMAPVDSEVSVHRAPDPVRVLHRQRPLEEVFVPDRLEVCRARILPAERCRRITGDRAHSDEHEHARQPDDDERSSELSQNEDPRAQRVYARL
jgi:hypothetical protein